MDKIKKAFSLAELILVVLIVGILAAVSVPRVNFGTVSKQKAATIANRIVTDLRRTRSMAISNGATNATDFAMDMVGLPPYRSYIIKDLQGNKVVDTLDIDSDVSCTGDTIFVFGPMGNLSGKSGQLKVSAGGRSFAITIVPATGMVKCVEN